MWEALRVEKQRGKVLLKHELNVTDPVAFFWIDQLVEGQNYLL